MLKRLLLWALCGALLLAPAACGEAEEEPAAQTEPTAEETYPTAYVPNETVNRFLVVLEERSGLTILGVEQGTTDDEYVIPLNGCRVSLSPSAQGMGVVIQGERGEAGQERLFTTFSYIALAADKGCTQDQIDDAIAFMKEQTSSSPAYRVCNEVRIQSYLPSVTVGGSETEPRLDLVLLNYVQTETEE